MRHVAPHRLAELAAGRLVGRAAARVRVHLDGCETCRGAWERVRRARGSFADIGAAPAPELKWDRMRAQVYWTMGSGAFPAVTPTSRRWMWLAVPAIAAAAAVALWQPWKREPARAKAPVALPAPGSAPGPAPVTPPERAIAVDLAPTALTGVVTLIEGDAALTRAGESELVEPDAIGAVAVGIGARLTTGEGRVALQLGAGTVATLAARSSLAVARFDEAAVELVIDGEVDLEVTRRLPGQRFAVLAGGRTVEVRGTAFRVSRRDGEVAVACEHGRVAISSSGDATVEVGAGQALSVLDAEPLLGRAPRPLGDAELAALMASRAAALPMWTDPATVLRTTAPLAVVAPRSRAVRVDGMVIGSGPVWMRVAPGRHLVEAEQAPGRFSPARWVEVGNGPSRPLVIAAATPPAASPEGNRAGRAARRAELARVLDQGRLRTCMRPLEKQGLSADTHVDLEVGVDGNGAIRFLNIADTNLPARTAGCVRDAVAASRLGNGAAATWRHRISF